MEWIVGRVLIAITGLGPVKVPNDDGLRGKILAADRSTNETRRLCRIFPQAAAWAANSDRHARASLKSGVGIPILYTVDHEDQSAFPLDAVANLRSIGK